MSLDTTFKRFKESKKIQHLRTCQNRALVLILEKGCYIQIVNCGNSCFQIRKNTNGSIEFANVFSIGVVFDFVKQVQPDMRKWRMS